MVNHPWEYHLDTSPRSSYMILQTHTFYHKIISIGIVFSYNYLFSSHTLAWSCVLHLKLVTYYLFPLYLIYFSTDFNMLYWCFLYACSTSTTIFKLIWSLKITPEYTLHNRVKDSITQKSIVIFSSNFKGRLIC